MTIANLLVWQVLILRPGRRSMAALVATLGVNVVVLAALVALRLRVK